MGYDVSTLAAYTAPNEKVLLVKALLEPKTISKIKAAGNIMTGVKSKSQLPAMETDAVFQDGAGCGFNASGTTKITAREVSIGKIKVQEALCPADLEASFEQLNLTKGSDYTEIAFAAEYSEQKVAKVANALEQAVWNGDTASGNVQLKRFDGLRKIIKAATNEIDGNTGAITVATGITKANVIAVIDAIVAAMPTVVRSRPDAFVGVGQEIFYLYVQALRDLNNYHLDMTAGASEEMKVWGTNITIIALPGLNDTKEIYASYWKNFYFATDLEGEEDKFDLKYAEEAEEVRFSMKFKAGVQVAFTDEVVKFVLVP